MTVTRSGVLPDYTIDYCEWCERMAPDVLYAIGVLIAALPAAAETEPSNWLVAAARSPALTPPCGELSPDDPWKRC